MQFYETNEIQLWGPKARKKGCLFLLLKNEWNSWNINLWNSWNRWNKNLWNSWNTPPQSWKKIFQLLWNKHRLSLRSSSFYTSLFGLKNSCIDGSLSSWVFDWAPYKIDKRRQRETLPLFKKLKKCISGAKSINFRNTVSVI